MKMLTTVEATEWCKAQGINLPDDGGSSWETAEFSSRRFNIPTEVSRQVWFCRLVERSLRPWSRCLLWVTEWGIWQSSENWHIYYRLRSSYEEFRLIEAAPAHLFLDFEIFDLVSFLQIALSSGWDIRLFAAEDYGRIVISHDQWIEFSLRDQLELQNIERELVKAGQQPI